MTVEQVKKFYEDKKCDNCELTDKLIKSGYQQKCGGYIKFAKEKGIPVDYTAASPSQGWHLIESWCNRSKPNHTFSRRIRCGELYFWMAEVSGAFTREELESLKEKAIKIAKANTPDGKLPLKTAKSNIEIRNYCFDRIVEAVEQHCNNLKNS